MHCCRYKQAADQGHADAMLEVAECYEEGRGVKKNKAEAIRQCKRAAAAGYEESYYRLYHLGEYNEAFVGLKKIADNDSSANRAFCLLGNCYEFGHGVAADKDAAIRMYLMANLAGDDVREDFERIAGPDWQDVVFNRKYGIPAPGCYFLPGLDSD